MARTTTNVDVHGLRQSFGRTTVLHGLDMEIETGVFGLLGPNGAGKTTLLRTLATVIKPSGGSMRLLGYDLSDHKQKRAFRQKLGYLPQSMGYYPNFTVWEFVEYFALLKEIPAREVNRAVACAIKRVELGEKARKQLRTLSGGQLRRVGIAQAIVNEPELLLLDEPTAGLDPEQRVAFRQLLREVGSRGTVIVSTHLVEDVGAACTEVAMMYAGRIVYQGAPKQLMALGDKQGVGDSPLERGYSYVLASAKASPHGNGLLIQEAAL
jgi:ABC-type multidrug transport system ATPase subunit